MVFILAVLRAYALNGLRIFLVLIKYSDDGRLVLRSGSHGLP